MELVGRQIDVCCIPERKDAALPSGESSLERGSGLRCRFSRPGEKFSYYPAMVTGDSSSATCKCDSEVLTKASDASLVWDAEEVPCRFERISTASDVAEEKNLEESLTGFVSNLSFLDRYLAVWIFVVMVIGVVLGKKVKAIRDAWDGAKVAEVSLPIAIGLWWMMYPILCKVRYEAMWKLVQSRLLLKHIGFSFVINWVVAPLLMTGLAWATLPDLDGYRNGIILVGIARCIAMVLIWNKLAGGNTEFCAILVAVNSVLQILLFSPLAIFYLKIVSNQEIKDVGMWTVARSVLLFLGLPLAAAVITRFTLRKIMGDKWYEEKFAPIFGPTALIGLLFTIFVMFSLKGDQVVDKFGEVCRIAVPLLLYFAITFFSSMMLCRSINIPYPDTVTQCFTASSNNFELAIAVAVASFGIDSDEALASVVGPLIEVPVLIGLVYVSLWLHKFLEWSKSKPVFDE